MELRNAERKRSSRLHITTLKEQRERLNKDKKRIAVEIRNADDNDDPAVSEDRQRTELLQSAPTCRHRCRRIPPHFLCWTKRLSPLPPPPLLFPS